MPSIDAPPASLALGLGVIADARSQGTCLGQQVLLPFTGVVDPVISSGGNCR